MSDNGPHSLLSPAAYTCAARTTSARAAVQHDQRIRERRADCRRLREPEIGRRCQMDMLFTLSCVLMFSGVHARTEKLSPLDEATQAYWAAHAAGHSDEARRAREQARSLLERMSLHE